MNINKILINSFVKSTEWAAYGASLFKGKNDTKSFVNNPSLALVKHIYKTNFTVLREVL